MGSAGVHLLMTALLALILTSLIGNLFTLSRIFMALSKDEILPAGVGKLNDKGTPAKAIMAAAGISMIMPFVGRTAIGWIVDVTTIGAVIVYGFVSASSYKMAKTHGTRTERDLGLAGLVIMIAFGAYLLIPNLFGEGGMEPASYFLFVIWSVLGFVFFRRLLLKDKEKRYGRTIVVWIALLSLILFISLVWMSQTSMETSQNVLMETSEVYGAGETADEEFISEKLDYMMWRQGSSLLLVIGLFGFSLAILMSNYSVISKRAEESERELGHVRDLANKDPLTGVKSKLAFREKEAELDKLIVSGELGDLSLAVLDVNGLKHINDTYGHKAGDAYILSASRLICEIFLHSPVYRIGGDEFAVILTGHDRECREELVSNFNKAVEDNLSDGGVVVSIGFSDYHADKDQNLHDVFVRADELMYKRKQQLKSMGARTRE